MTVYEYIVLTRPWTILRLEELGLITEKARTVDVVIDARALFIEQAMRPIFRRSRGALRQHRPGRVLL